MFAGAEVHGVALGEVVEIENGLGGLVYSLGTEDVGPEIFEGVGAEDGAGGDEGAHEVLVEGEIGFFPCEATKVVVEPVLEALGVGDEFECFRAVVIDLVRRCSATAGPVGHHEFESVVEYSREECDFARAGMARDDDAVSVEVGEGVKVVEDAGGPPGPDRETGPVVFGVGRLCGTDVMAPFNVRIEILVVIAGDSITPLVDGFDDGRTGANADNERYGGFGLCG